MLGTSGAVVMFGNERVSKLAMGASAVTLEASAYKQCAFRDPTLSAPAVWARQWVGGETYAVEMARVTGHSPDRWLKAVPKLLDFVHRQYHGAEETIVSAEAVSRKLSDVLFAIRSQAWRTNSTIERAFGWLRERTKQGVRVYRQIDARRAPHGDLTLCNVLATSTDVYLIDFHDAFLVSPLHDLTKLRQDTRWGWCNAVGDEAVVTFDKLGEMDQLVRALLFAAPDRDSYPVMEVMNLVRILPYVKKPAALLMLLDSLASCIR